MFRPSAFLALVVACAAFSNSVTAATYDWTNNAGGAFSTPANWSPAGGPPGSSDIARFGNASTYTVTFGTLTTVNTLTQTQGDVTFDLNSNTFRANNNTNNSMGANGLTSTLRIFDGSFRPASFTVGAALGSVSNLFLDTDSSTTLGTGPFYVGSNGVGALTVQNGATLFTPSGAALGLNTGSVGTATVAGLDSEWEIINSPLRIGSFGTGTLNILSNGTVTAPGLEIGEKLNSTGTMSLSGLAATFSTNGTANIGGNSASSPAASATLNVGPGSIVTLGGTTNLRTNARVNVTGGTLNLNTVTVANGAAVNWSSGTINLASAPAINANLLDTLLGGTRTLGPNRTLSATAGTLNLNSTLIVDGGHIMAPIIDMNANMELRGFSNVIASNTINILAGRTIQLGNFSTLTSTNPITNNGGTLVLDGQFATVAGAFSNNSGFVRGVGRFTGGLNNAATGIIRAGAGDHLIIDQIGRTNAGAIELADGTIEYTKDLINQVTGFITGRGVYRGSSSAPGGNGLTNLGVMSFSAGITDIFGDVDNTGTGKIIAAGGSVVTYYDDVVHNGIEIRTNTGSRSVFFGSVTGAGPFTGGGDVEFNGDLRPGNSPANVSFAGNIVVGPTAGLDIELAGIAKGTGYDSLTVAGAAALGGTLDVSLLGGFVPTAGQSFEILTAAGGINGTFDAVNLPSLAAGLYLDLNYNPNSVLLTVAGTLGDYNYDGLVDAADYVVWRKFYSASPSPTDYIAWQANYATPSSSGNGGSDTPQVPEPAAILLIAFALALFTPRRAK